MAHHLYTTGEFQINGAPGSIEQLEGRFAFINQLDKYDNDNFHAPKRTFFTLNSREREYQKFLYYKNFFAHEKPLVVTEGKTDILYIKAALKSMYKGYPDLIEVKPDGSFNFKIRFLRKSKKLKYFFNLSVDGADTMKNIYGCYVEKKGKGTSSGLFPYFSQISTLEVQQPVVLVFDNEQGDKSKPLYKFLNFIGNDNPGVGERLKTSFCERLLPESNLFLVTHQLVGGKNICEIEDLLPQQVRDTVIDGKKLSLQDNYDTKTEYGKDAFSKYVLEHYDSIDFSGFVTLLDGINSTVVKEREQVMC